MTIEPIVGYVACAGTAGEARPSATTKTMSIDERVEAQESRYLRMNPASMVTLQVLPIGVLHTLAPGNRICYRHSRLCGPFDRARYRTRI